MGHGYVWRGQTPICSSFKNNDILKKYPLGFLNHKILFMPILDLWYYHRLGRIDCCRLIIVFVVSQIAYLTLYQMIISALMCD